MKKLITLILRRYLSLPSRVEQRHLLVLVSGKQNGENSCYLKMTSFAVRVANCQNVPDPPRKYQRNVLREGEHLLSSSINTKSKKTKMG